MYSNQSNGHLGNGSIEGVQIRLASASDDGELEQLRQLDSRPDVRDLALVAEVDGHLLAAISETGEVIADPFKRTAETVDLLRLRARQLASSDIVGPNDRFSFRSRGPATSLRPS
jgi:hypothetical protein